MKRIKRIITLLLAAFFMCFSFAGVCAEASGPTRITFTNAKSNQPDLFVNKHVIADAGYPAPKDAEFTFRLKLDGEFAKKQKYIVLDVKGTEVDKGVTNYNGEFKLKAEQTAKFEYLGSGIAFEIQELETQNFIQVSPAQGTDISGIIPSEGVRVQFTNQYVPNIPGKKADLTITKRVTYPAGYQIPGEPVEFSFVLTLNGKAYANEQYTVKSSETEETLETRITDGEGTLVLKADETAVFKNVAAGVDYNVVEQETDGWSVVGNTTQEGAVVAPSTDIYYANKMTAFGVKKIILNGDSGDTDFKFLLLKGDKKAWADVSYHLYNSDGTLVDTAERKTDEKGYFTLKGGQTAIFTGIPENSIYHVSEVAQTGYTQVTPADPQGYQNKAVKDNVEVLPFENKVTDENGNLIVTKIVENVSDDAAHADAEFTFVLREKTDDNTYQPVAKAVYSIAEGTSTGSYETNEKGEFKLKTNQIARFDRLTSGKEYQVEELQNVSGYIIHPDTPAVQNKVLTADETAEFKFINQFGCTFLDLKIHKKNHDNEVLEGAVFDLYMDETLINRIGQQLTTDKNGEIRISELKPGTYYLKEVKAPDGYELLENPIKIEVLREGTADELKVKVDGTEYTGTDPADQIYIEKPAAGNDIVHITVYNNRPFWLPITGGTGVTAFVIIAIVGIVSVMRRLRKKV